MVIREAKCWPGCRHPVWLRIVPTLTGRSRSILMGKTSGHSWIIVRIQAADVQLCCLAAGSLAVFLDHAPGFRGVFLTDQDDVAANPWKNVLLRIERSQVRVDAGGFEQATDYQGFGFLFGVEHPHQLFFGVGACCGGTRVPR